MSTELRRRFQALRAVVIGGLNIDRILITDAAPVNDGCVLCDVHTEFGGHAGNAATALARLGVLEVTLLGAVGADDTGDAITADLKRAGVYCELMQRVEGISTGEVIIPCFSGQRYMLMNRGANEYLQLQLDGDAARAVVEADVVVVFDPPRPVLNALQSLRLPRGFIWNPGGFYPGCADFHRLVDGVSTLVLNRVEFALAFPSGRIPIHMVGTAKRSPLVIQTLANHGCLVFNGETMERYHGFLVDTVDETGAGDAFTAAFAAFSATFMPTSKAVVYASAVAALSTKRVGARAGLPNFDEALALVSKELTMSEVE